MLSEAEGYLDLITVLSDRWSLSAAVRDRVGERILALLDPLESAPDLIGEVMLLKGLTLRTMERYGEAIEPLSLAGDEDPENLHIWLALGWCYKRTGRLDLAIRSLEEALAAEPREAIVHYNLACYWSLADNAPVAIEFLSRALQIDPAFRDLVADEPDFDRIRDQPQFQHITSVIV